MCGSEELSREASYQWWDNQTGSSPHHVRFARGGNNGKDLLVTASKARVCLDCGYLMMLIADGDLERVRTMERD
jgi:hypothetical protein